MTPNKPKVIKDYSKLDDAIKEQIKLVYPNGFAQYLITFPNKDGLLVSALPFETDEKYYLVRMTTEQADNIISDDEDYDDEGTLKDESKAEYEDKYAELEYIADNLGDDNEETFEDEGDEEDDLED